MNYIAHLANSETRANSGSISIGNAKNQEQAAKIASRRLKRKAKNNPEKYGNLIVSEVCEAATAQAETVAEDETVESES